MSIINIMYKTPFIIERADPYIYKHEDGLYYMTASVPAYDLIELRCGRTIEELATNPVKNVWHKHKSGDQSELIWAPEIHYVEGSFYIYYAASHTKEQHEYDHTFQHRMYAIKCSGNDPMVDEWEECGQIITRQDSFALDATVLKTKHGNYYIWAQKEIGSNSNSNIYIAKMLSPTVLSDKQVCISKPELDWETKGFKVNEGPATIINDGRVFLTISGSSTDENYCIGLLYADINAELDSKAAWTKLAAPLMVSDEANKRIGPGHNSFTYDFDGQPLIVYHCRPSKVSLDEALYNPNRDMCIQEVFFDQNNLMYLEKPKKMTWNRLGEE